MMGAVFAMQGFGQVKASFVAINTAYQFHSSQVVLLCSSLLLDSKAPWKVLSPMPLAVEIAVLQWTRCGESSLVIHSKNP